MEEGDQGRRNSRGRRGHGRGTFWPISIFIYRKSIEENPFFDVNFNLVVKLN